MTPEAVLMHWRGDVYVHLKGTRMLRDWDS
jgi:hypothetical protein